MTTNSIKVLCDLCFHLVVHAVVIVFLLTTYFLATTCHFLLALRIPVHSLHLDNVFILVGGVDVVLEGPAENPPLHNVAKKKTE